MARVSHLLRRGASYSARIRVPLDLVDVVGRRELVRALGTNDEAEAKRKLWPVITEWNRQFDDLRASRALVPTDMEHATWDHYVEALARDDHNRARLPGDDQIEAEKAELIEKVERGEIASTNPLAILDATLELKVKQEAADIASEARQAKLTDLRKHLSKGETALIAADVDNYLRQNSLLVDRATPDWISLARHMMRAEIEALQRGLERDRGDYTGQPSDPLVKPAIGPRREAAKPGESIMEIFEIFARENPRGVAKDRVDQCRRDIGTFVDLVGASFPVARIAKAEVRDWKQLLVKYPVKATETKAFSGMNIQQVIKANERIGKPVIVNGGAKTGHGAAQKQATFLRA